MPNIGSAPTGLNSEKGLIAQSNTGVRTDPVVDIYADPTTHRLLVDVVGAVAITPLFAAIAVSSSGVNNLVAAQAGKSIRVLQVVLVSNGAVNIKFQSHVTPTDLTGLFYLIANTGFSSGYSPVGQFQTTIGEALDINLSGAVAIGGYLTYILV